jgi:hypothetical protein
MRKLPFYDIVQPGINVRWFDLPAMVTPFVLSPGKE